MCSSFKHVFYVLLIRFGVIVVTITVVFARPHAANKVKSSSNCKYIKHIRVTVFPRLFAFQYLWFHAFVDFFFLVA